MKAHRQDEQETVSVTVRGRLLDRRTFASRDDANTYKQASRAWAARRKVVVEVWSELRSARPASRAQPALTAQAG